MNGYVDQGSIVRNGASVSFVLHQNPGMLQKDPVRLKVVYSGIDPLPDTFKDDAQALADGSLGPDGVFQASKIQAKCASKYEAKPQMKTDAKPANQAEHASARHRTRSRGLKSSNGKYRRSRRFCSPFAWPFTRSSASVVGKLQEESLSWSSAASARSIRSGYCSPWRPAS